MSKCPNHMTHGRMTLFVESPNTLPRRSKAIVFSGPSAALTCIVVSSLTRNRLSDHSSANSKPELLAAETSVASAMDW